MKHRYRKHYTLAEARALLPQLRPWLRRLGELRLDLVQREESLTAMRADQGDLGGEPVNSWVRLMAEMRDLLLEFNRREIEIKDLDRGLVDFPALREGREVFLCWELAEADIEFWHDLDAGYAGRQPLGQD